MYDRSIERLFSRTSLGWAMSLLAAVTVAATLLAVMAPNGTVLSISAGLVGAVGFGALVMLAVIADVLDLT